MITKFLEDNIELIDSVDSWENSIRLASEKLLKKNYITDNYVDSMIENVLVNGPYVVIMPMVAIPHSRPEEGAKKTTISLLKLGEPVKFPEEKEVKLIFILAANDNDNHLKLISSLSDLLVDNEKVEMIMGANSEKEILSILD